METQVWFRNPDNYVRELVEAGEYKVTWDRGVLVKKRIDAYTHAMLYFGRTFPWRLLMVGSQGTAELDAEHPFEKPAAVYPTWEFGEPIELLEDILMNPPGQSMEACMDMSVPPDERPVWGQEHRVVITSLPHSSTGPGRKFFRQLKELQEEYPNSIIHVHGLYGYKMAFGMSFGAADVEPRTAAQKGKLHMPSGGETAFEVMHKNPKWATVLGFKPVDLEVPRNRCIYNIKSAVWCGENYSKLLNFKIKDTATPDYTSSDAAFTPDTNKQLRLVNAQPGDKLACDSCSLALSCKYHREGAVCSVPGSEANALTRMFKTRDADDIVDGLGELVQRNIKRLQRGMDAEEAFDELDPAVSKLMDSVFTQGERLAKLIDPSKRTAAGVQVNIGAQQAINGPGVTMADPRQLVAGIIKELSTKHGIPRDQITPDMVKNALNANQPAHEAVISGRAITE